MTTLDHVNLAAFSGLAVPAVSRVDWLNPWIELEWMKASGHDVRVEDYASDIAEMRHAVREKRAYWTRETNNCRRGFVRTWRAWADVTQSSWVAFLEALVAATVCAGLHRSIAQQLAGAVRELEDNIHDHCGKSRSGMVAFSARSERIEIVIVDRGMGILGSLQKAPEFAALTTCVEALQVAVRSGASRYGLGHGHGQGFNRLFLGLADTAALLRFRSGDALLEIDGRSPAAMTSATSPAADGKGLLISIQIDL